MVEFNPSKMREGADQLDAAGRKMIDHAGDFEDLEQATRSIFAAKPEITDSTQKAAGTAFDFLTALARRSREVAAKVDDAAGRVETDDSVSANNMINQKLHSGLKIQ